MNRLAEKATQNVNFHRINGITLKTYQKKKIFEFRVAFVDIFEWQIN